MADRKNIQKADRVKKAENGQKRLNSPGSKLTQGKPLRNVSSSKTRLCNKGRDGAGINSLGDD